MLIIIMFTFFTYLPPHLYLHHLFIYPSPHLPNLAICPIFPFTSSSYLLPPHLPPYRLHLATYLIYLFGTTNSPYSPSLTPNNYFLFTIPSLL